MGHLRSILVFLITLLAAGRAFAQGDPEIFEVEKSSVDRAAAQSLGALLVHFAQGEGEVCGTGIDVAGAVTVRLGLDRSPAWRPRFPAYETPARPAPRALATTGISLRDDGGNEELDVGLAARQALLEMIDYLTGVRGLGREQAYVLASVAVDLRISEVVDVPNALVSALLPLDVFER